MLNYDTNFPHNRNNAWKKCAIVIHNVSHWNGLVILRQRETEKSRLLKK